MPSEFEPANTKVEESPTSTPRPIVTWEDLEANARHFAELLDEPAPIIALKEGVYKKNLAVARGNVPIDPGLFAILDRDESAFYVAYMMIAIRSMQGLTGPSKGKQTISFDSNLGAAITMGACTGITLLVVFALIPRSGRFDFLQILLPVLVLIPVELLLLRRVNLRYFKDAVSLTGNAAAGRSCLRKVFAFYRTGRGKKPLTGFRRFLAGFGAWMSIPNG